MDAEQRANAPRAGKVCDLAWPNKTKDGLHLRTLAQLEDTLRLAGFMRWEIDVV